MPRLRAARWRLPRQLVAMPPAASCAWMRRSHQCQRFQQNSELTHNFVPSFQKKWPPYKNCNGKSHVLQRDRQDLTSTRTLWGKTCRKADSICRGHAGRESRQKLLFRHLDTRRARPRAAANGLPDKTTSPISSRAGRLRGWNHTRASSRLLCERANDPYSGHRSARQVQR